MERTIENGGNVTIDGTSVYPREVVKEALRVNAAAVILAHNHPSGDPSPSDEDVRVTERLVDAGKILGIQVLDHIIVARHQSLSIREHG